MVTIVSGASAEPMPLCQKYQVIPAVRMVTRRVLSVNDVTGMCTPSTGVVW